MRLAYSSAPIGSFSGISGIFLLDLSPGVAQADRAVEDGRAGLVILDVRAEVGLPLELPPAAQLGDGEGRLDLALLQHLERSRIEVVQPAVGGPLGLRRGPVGLG